MRNQRSGQSSRFCVQRSILLTMLVLLPLAATGFAAQDFDERRRKMVDVQLRGRDITAPTVLAAMGAVPRHRFVPADLRHLAYHDTPLPIGHGQTISQPYIVALMTQVLDLSPDSRVLEIGTGSGYQAAVLAQIGATVFTVEIVPELGRRARKTLEALGYEKVNVKIGDGYQGWPEDAPFDAIIVTCAPTAIPRPLTEQLAEGGRMVIPVGERHAQRLLLLTKKNNRIQRERIVAVRFVPMVDEKGKTY